MIQSKDAFLVCGAGSWGTALALHLARQGNLVGLWGHRPEQIEEMRKKRVNQTYLPGFELPASIMLFSQLSEAFSQLPANTTLLLAVPSFAFEDTLISLQSHLIDDPKILWVTKGLSPHGEWLHHVVQRHFRNSKMACLSGPSFAKEVAKALPTAVTIACEHNGFSQSLMNAFHGANFRVYQSRDIIGVEVGGLVKNMLAIAVGMSDGLGYGANARSALITRGIAEMCRFGAILGAKQNTLMGLSGLGDVILTCTDNQSRNRRFGLMIGEGQSIDNALKSIGQVVEGKANAPQLINVAKQLDLEMPICQQVYDVLYQGVPAKQAVVNLLSRPPKEES
jgi:glycerol-3-phosphate dehydrogenase (NAD(P)+)